MQVKASPKAMEITVLLADDHPVVRNGYRYLLDGTPDIRVVAEVATCNEVCESYAKASPWVVVIDLKMPGIGGIETIRHLRRADSAARVLVFSALDSDVMIEQAVKAGALGYLLKSSPSELMADAIRTVAAGRPFIDPQLATIMAVGRLRGENGPLSALTAREFEVFRLLAEGQSVAQIAKQLFISPKTASVHQTNITNKLGLENTTQLVRLAIACKVIEP